MKKRLLYSLLTEAPTSWAIIRAAEIEILSGLPFPKPILEIGCGDGLVSRVLFKRKGVIDYAIDIDPSEVARARQTGIYKKVLTMNAAHMSFKTNSFRTVFSNGVLEHIEALPEVLREIERVMQPGGQLIFTCPTNHYKKNLLGYKLFRTLKMSTMADAYGDRINAIFRHFNLHDHREWQSLLKTHRLVLKKYYYYNPKLLTKIHEFCLITAIPSKFTKKYFDRIVLGKSIRSKFFLSWWTQLLTAIPSNNEREENKQSSIVIVAQKP